MKKLKKTFGEGLEQFEIAKLREKYEKLGYIFHENYRIRKNKEPFILDAYAKNAKTKDEIIFEVKASESIKKGDTDEILKQRNKYLSFFPGARFVLVLARKSKELEIEKSELNTLLLEFIRVKYKDLLKSKIEGFEEIESIENISFEKVNLKDFSSINIDGYANLKFWINFKDKEINGVSLSDGIPFKFIAKLEHNMHNPYSIYSLKETAEIEFDLSEFEI